MNRLAVAFILVVTLLASSAWAGKTVQVRGYYRKDGTYVRPHTRSTPGSGSSYVPTPFVPPPVTYRRDYRSAPPETEQTFDSILKDSRRLSDLQSRPTVRRTIPVPADYPFRTWKDFSGQFKVVAKFRSFANGTVTIEKEDGKRISLGLDRLSFDDQMYVKGLW